MKIKHELAPGIFNWVDAPDPQVDEGCPACQSQEDRAILRTALLAANGVHAAAKHFPPRTKPFLHWLSTAQLTIDAIRLASLLPAETSRIVGIPRSGSIVAAIIATHLHLPLWELSGGKLYLLNGNSRGWMTRQGPTVVVDDTVHGGHAMTRARVALKDPQALYAAVYITSDRVQDVNYYVEAFHHRLCLLEWNFFNNHGVLRNGVATDLDGILCEDPRVPDADEGVALDDYRRWLANAAPKWPIRAHPAKAIVTARLEKFRTETAAWLARWGVRYDKLVMHPALKASERGDIAAWKAAEFRKTPAAFIVESDARQAERIHLLTRRQVVCPAAERVWR